MNENLITITGLTKKYRKRKPLNDINLSLQKGKSLGYLVLMVREKQLC